MTTRAAQIECLLTPVIDYRTGAVASGFTVYFYSAGTSTAKNVWTEKEKTNAYTSRTLGSNGIAQVYGDGVYKIVVKDADGTTVYEWDNVKVQANTFTVQSKADTYTATIEDDVVFVDTTSAEVTINCQTVVNFTHPLTIKIIAGSNNVVFTPYGDETVDGEATDTLSTVEPAGTYYPDVSAGVWRKGGVTNLGGLTASVTELNVLDGVTAFLDENAMTTNSATAIASQQSIKAYVDAQAAATLTLTNKTLTTPKINEDVQLSATATQLNQMGSLLGLPFWTVKRSKFTYNGGAASYTIKVGAGMYYVKDKVAKWVAELTTAAIGTPAADTWYYLYLDYSAITSWTNITANELIWSDTAPTYSHTLGGWYNGDDLCIFADLTNSGPNNIYWFWHDGGDYVLWDGQFTIFTAADLDADWVDVTVFMPAFATRAQCTFGVNYQDGAISIRWRPKGAGSATGHTIQMQGSDIGFFTYNTVTVMTDASQVMQISMSASNEGIGNVLMEGWYLPNGI